MKRAGIALLWLFVGCQPAADPRPNVVLVTLDTTRADHLDVYGYPGETSPGLSAFAEEAVTFTAARSTSSWTLPAHASLFTGLLSHEHGVRYDAAGSLVLEDAIAVAGSADDHPPYRVRGLGPGFETLAENLRGRGYDTAGVVAGPWLMAHFGLDRGFDFYDDAEISSDVGRRAGRVTTAALEWLAERRGDPRPFFLFLNYFDPHTPYHAPPRFRGSDRSPVAAYDEEIRFVDHQLRRLFEALAADGLLEATLVVVTADHGELLGEHGRFGHGASLEEPLLRVPLLVRPPGGTAARQSGLSIQLSDVYALILGLVDAPDADVVATAREATAAGGGRSFAEVWPIPGAPDSVRWRTVIEEPFKLVASPEIDYAMLFDLEADPGEERNLAEQHPEVVARLRALLAARATAPGAPALEVEGKILEQLKSLGYGR